MLLLDCVIVKFYTLLFKFKMNNSSQTISEQSRKLKELKQELNQIKGGQMMNKTVIQNNLNQTSNDLRAPEPKTNQTQIVTTQKIDIDYSDDSDNQD